VRQEDADEAARGDSFGEFSSAVIVKTSMLTEAHIARDDSADTDTALADALETDLGSLTTEDATETSSPPLDAETLFTTALAQTNILTGIEERELTRNIARARKRVRAILRKARRLTRAALADSGRGVVAPEQDFRERETLVILAYAQRALHDTHRARALGAGRKELRAFIDQLSAALGAYRVLRDAMVRANVRLVSVLARRFHHPSLTFLDLFQEGTIGLLRAIEKYDPERNIKFSTYATWWIWQQLGRAADTQGALIRTPVHWNQLRRRVSRDVHAHAGDKSGPLSREELAAAHGMDPTQMDTMAQTFQFTSTDAPVSEDDDRVLESMLAAEGSEPEEQALRSSLRERLEIALRQLPARERMILRQRFGLDDDESETLEQISVRLAVSRERVRQLESRALKRLKDVCASEGLHEYLH
jgi:RNA polymerase primary sigma factor